MCVPNKSTASGVGFATGNMVLIINLIVTQVWIAQDAKWDTLACVTQISLKKEVK